jgi:5-formyltetrahydrofolate cyclo-ligase
VIIGQRLRRLLSYRTAQTVMFFVTHGSEVMTELFIEQAWVDKKDVVVPFIDKATGVLKAAKVTSLFRDLAEGMYGIKEPVIEQCTIVHPRNIDVVFVPAFAFDKNGNRVGYGKGYYDTWLQHFPFSKRIGLAFDFQVVQQVPIESHDVPVARIVTEKRVVPVVEKKVVVNWVNK